ncbi:hypothetical protein [Nocardioides piscis]|uniref:TOMM leader peptide-binding protein n=1 Tax=Nocardioides piscis TaxID=2714938 RepID=A0A6G7YG61_9ACTN|nr:hypothetical protein [Nocardioides piscis]QIK75656.1 hypothetical protein G7071_09565 [Nocardioides piscis]
MFPSRRHEPPRAQVHAPGPYADVVTTVVTAAGLRPCPTADVALLLTTSQDPGVADRWLVDSLPHLVVSVTSDEGRIGPFVDPGATACLRCLTAAGAEPGPAPGAPAVPTLSPPDPALLVLTLGWAVHELETWQAGELPVTWSSTITVRRGAEPEVTRWLRHPHCGCAWDLFEVAG